MGAKSRMWVQRWKQLLGRGLWRNVCAMYPVYEKGIQSTPQKDYYLLIWRNDPSFPNECFIFNRQRHLGQLRIPASSSCGRVTWKKAGRLEYSIVVLSHTSSFSLISYKILLGKTSRTIQASYNDTGSTHWMVQARWTESRSGQDFILDNWKPATSPLPNGFSWVQ